MVLITVRNILIYQAVALLSALIRLLIVGSYIRRQFPFLSAQTDVVYIPPKQVQRRHVLVSEIAGLVIDSTDLVVLSTFSGLISASIYSVYSFVTSGIGNILSSCREAVFAGIGRAYFSDFEGFKRKMDRFESLYFSITFFLYTTTILLYKPFITVYTKKMDAGYVLAGLPILFVLAKLLVNLRIPAIVAINTAGHFEQVKNYAVIEAAINLILSLLFVRAYGIYGVLGGTIIGSLYRTPILIRYSNKQIYKRSAFCYWKKILIWLPVFAASYVLSFYVPISCTSLTMWIVMAVPTATIVFAVCILWMMLFDKTTFHFLRRIVLHRRKAD